MAEYTTITSDRPASAARAGLIPLNRPEALNALNRTMMLEVVHAATEFDRSPDIGAIVITGSARAFAAGADIKEMQHQGFPGVYVDDLFHDWDRLSHLPPPPL